MTDAKEYGRALFLLSEEESCAEAVAEELRTVIAAFDANPEYIKLLDTPALGKEERVGLIDEAFSALNENLKNLLKIMVEARSVHRVHSVAKAYFDLYDTSRGILRATAITAVALTEEQHERLTKKLAERTGKTVVLTNEVDKGILGGVKLRYSGIQLDGSVKTRLDKFEEALVGAVI
ncbi:MAG: ATP synthase F1 subunit delta [Clostridia bacterium]|nr:ATP synthase F1 subunit delta [Clostridia bacterium]